MAWVSDLSVSIGGYTLDNWRLPSAMNLDGSGPCTDYRCIDSEMGHLFYTELGNVGARNEYGNPTGCSNDCLTNTGEFQNLQASNYWLGTEYSIDPNLAWSFYTYDGVQWMASKHYGNRAMAVMDGDILITPPSNDIDIDHVLDDGDGSNILGDHPCSEYITVRCDDNCPDTYNPDQKDSDFDGIGDVCDNCTEIPNKDQRDTNSDEDDNIFLEGIQHYGNICDGDFDNNGIVEIRDFILWRPHAGQQTDATNEDMDMNGNGAIWTDDFVIWRGTYGKVPGPGFTE